METLEFLPDHSRKNDQQKHHFFPHKTIVKESNGEKKNLGKGSLHCHTETHF